VLDIIARRASIQEVQQITYSIASGLKSLHDKNFVHRDIKPENVLVSGPASRMIVKLADFGLAGYMKDGRKLR
jgi:serine/threonine protein kinase